MDTLSDPTLYTKKADCAKKRNIRAKTATKPQILCPVVAINQTSDINCASNSLPAGDACNIITNGNDTVKTQSFTAKRRKSILETYINKWAEENKPQKTTNYKEAVKILLEAVDYDITQLTGYIGGKKNRGHLVCRKKIFYGLAQKTQCLN
ncbi:MAG: hypothetical protein CVU77_04475 [Elusimicrobia bacterium HGW-Elusimicrobia-1]|nr:MAG: hypothetical protein CVU77_04475 [Elusimicrobia bacterium HGW-Elusimicrobia-1]